MARVLTGGNDLPPQPPGFQGPPALGGARGSAPVFPFLPLTLVPPPRIGFAFHR